MPDIRTPEGREELRWMGDAVLDDALDGLDIAQRLARLLRLLTACHQGLPNQECTYCDILAEWDNWQKEGE